MFAGHLAAGLVLKNMERRLNLAWLFFAGLFHDFLFGILVLLGLEQVHIPSNFAQTHLGLSLMRADRPAHAGEQVQPASNW